MAQLEHRFRAAGGVGPLVGGAAAVGRRRAVGFGRGVGVRPWPRPRASPLAAGSWACTAPEGPAPSQNSEHAGIVNQGHVGLASRPARIEDPKSAAWTELPRRGRADVVRSARRRIAPSNLRHGPTSSDPVLGGARPSVPTPDRQQRRPDASTIRRTPEDCQQARSDVRSAAVDAAAGIGGGAVSRGLPKSARSTFELTATGRADGLILGLLRRRNRKG